MNNEVKENLEKLSKEEIIEIVTDFWASLKLKSDSNLKRGTMDEYEIIGKVQLLEVNRLSNVILHKVNTNDNT